MIMSRSELLTELATRLEEWPDADGNICKISKETGEFVTSIGWNGGNQNREPDHVAVTRGYVNFSKHEWLAERARLKTGIRAEAPAWDGKGERPPVGTRCRKGHMEVLILAYADAGSPVGPAVVYQSIEDPADIDWAVSNVFSPIRSEEDVAVSAMIVATESDSSAPNYYRAVYRAIRDGKVPGVKLENGS